jgi:hypothetical protein
MPNCRLRWRTPAQAVICRQFREVFGPPGLLRRGLRAFLEMFEHMGDFLPGLFGVIHRHVLAFLRASRRVAGDVFA